MITVEGPDGAGKTTLCARVCQDFDLEMGQRGTKNRDLLYKVTRADTWNAVRHELAATAPPLVWDRLGPFSDPIYSRYGVPVRQCAFALRELAFMKQFIRQFQCPVILCLPPFEDVYANVSGERHQMEGVEDNIHHIYQEYSNISRYHYVPVTRFDYTRPGSYDDVYRIIKSFLGLRREREILS